MERLTRWIKPSTVLAGFAVTAALLLLPASSLSIDWGHGGGEWVRTPAAVAKDPICYAAGQDFCREWCVTNTPGGVPEPTGEFCCTGPDGVCNGSDLEF